MKRVPGFLRFFLWSLIVIVALGGALFGYFVYSPAPEVPRLSGTLTQGTIEVGGRTRTYLSYAPLGLTKGAPLVVVMHGSGQTVRKCESGQGMGSSACGRKRLHGIPQPYWRYPRLLGPKNRTDRQ
jgi:polyhydroxybutyrate depolymerase